VNGQIVTLTWAAPVGPVIGYRLEAGTGPGLANIIVFDVGPMTSLTVTAPPGSYYTRVRALSSDGVSGPSNEILVSVRQGEIPAFGPGQYRVNIDIAPGRYYSDPRPGCYWERQRGFSGSLADIIANEFIDYDARQWIIDILPTDVGFETDFDCGNWFTTPRLGGPLPGIVGGVYLVGAQIRPGTYSTFAANGCYWARLRDFTGNFSGIIDNEFITRSTGDMFVTIAPTDVGFELDGDCWPLVLDRLGSDETATQSQTTRSDIEFQWRANYERRFWFGPRLLVK
jgi:hypothetical protein